MISGAEPRRSRPAKNLCRLRRRRGTYRPAHRDSGQDHQGLWHGSSGEAQNITHQQKKMDIDSLKAFRDRFKLPIKDDDIESLPYLKFAGRLARTHLHARTARKRWADLLARPPAQVSTTARCRQLSAFDALLKAGGEGREFSSTMAFVRA
jgi:pyruvate dehydrogenase E1 component